MQRDHKRTGKSASGLTLTMENYLETVYRLNADVVRINNIAAHLHIPFAESAAIAKELRDKGFVGFEKYGFITLTESGRQMGEFLTRRHETVVRLLRTVNGDAFFPEEADDIKHFLSRDTVGNIEKYLNTNIL